jgi:hypothetical protein
MACAVLIGVLAAAGTPVLAASRVCTTPHHHCHDSALTMKCSCGVEVHAVPAAVVDGSTRLVGATSFTIVAFNVDGAIAGAMTARHVVMSPLQTGPPDLPVRFSSLLL